MTSGDGQAARAPARGAASASLASRLLPYGRAVIAGLLLLIVLTGIRAAGPAVGSAGPLRQHPVAVGAGLEIALACLLVALAIRARRAPDAGRLAATLRGHVRRSAAIIMVAVVVLEFVNVAGHGQYERQLLAPKHVRPGRLPGQRGTRLPPAGHPVNLSYLLYALLAAAILAAIVACAIFVSRLHVRETGGELAEPSVDESEDLRQAVESGRSALRTLDDARTAIIACYVAMEASLARAGAARAVTETPDELLARAAASGLIRGQAATSLTALFYEARFSSHQLPGSAKDAATRALDAISAELRAPAPDAPDAPPATAPAGGQGT